MSLNLQKRRWPTSVYITMSWALCTPISHSAGSCRKNMDAIHKFLNIVIPLVLAPIGLLLVLPPYLLSKLLTYIKRSIFPQDLAGKVVLITGASSGIGEHVAYEYARRGARLALVARREDRLKLVAEKARELGSPDIFMVRADVSKEEDCRRLVDETIGHFKELDHLVVNAGIAKSSLFEDCAQISDFAPIMDINYWGSIYCTHAATPHLRKSKGKIVVIASVAAWSATPRLSFYNASKSALLSFFETLRIEFGSHIGITIVTPGVITSEMTSSAFLSKVSMKNVPPAESTEACAKAIVNSARRGDLYLTEPFWVGVPFIFKFLCPEVYNWSIHLLFLRKRY